MYWGIALNVSSQDDRLIMGVIQAIPLPTYRETDTQMNSVNWVNTANNKAGLKHVLFTEKPQTDPATHQ